MGLAAVFLYAPALAHNRRPFLAMALPSLNDDEPAISDPRIDTPTHGRLRHTSLE